MIENLAPNFHIWAVFAMVALVIIVYALDRFSIEAVSLGAMVSFLLFFQIFPIANDEGKLLLKSEELLTAFANPALITVMAFLVLGNGVVRSGVLNGLGEWSARHFSNHRFFGLALFLVLSCILSAFFNNTTQVVIFIPVLAAFAHRLKIAPSKVMIPLAYASSIGGMTTLIGTSTNMLISGKLETLGHEPLGFFDFTLPGVILCAVGMLYVGFLLPRILPDRRSMVSDMIDERQRQYIAELRVNSDFLTAHGEFIQPYQPFYRDLTVRLVQRGEQAFLPPFDERFTLREQDVLVVVGTREALANTLQQHPEMLLEAGAEAPDNGIERPVLCEAIVPPGSRFIGQSPEMLALRHRYHVAVLGIQRGSHAVRSKIAQLRFQTGDMLLMLAPRLSVKELERAADLVPLEVEHPDDATDRRLIWRVMVIFGGVVFVSSMEWMPISIAVLTGAFLMVATGCMNMRQAIRSLDKQVFFIISTSFMMSLAIERTGGAELIANWIATVGKDQTYLMLALFFTGMIIMNEIMSNNAAGLLFTPVALELAEITQAPEKMFIWAVIFAGSCSFATPIGYQTNMLVMGPGHYKFLDYVKAGIPLNVILLVTYLGFCSFYF